MGRITTRVTITNPLEPARQIHFDALVDTGAAWLVLPAAWKDRLGTLAQSRSVEVETADQRLVRTEIGGPVTIQIEGFDAISSEVAFLDMAPTHGSFEPLLGYIVLEQSLLAVDLLRHQLVALKSADLKVASAPHSPAAL